MNSMSLCSADEVSDLTSLSPSQLRLMARRGEFPAPRKLSQKRVAWVRSEVDGWIASKVGGIAGSGG